MKEIVIIQRILPEYRRPIFDSLFKTMKFTLLHSTNNSGIKQASTEYSVIISKVQYGKGDTHLFLNVFPYLRLKKPRVVIHELAVGIISLPLVLFLRKVLGYKFILWGHTYNRKKGFNPQRFSDKYRLWLQRKADAIITYSQSEKDILINNKISANKIFPALNTLDTNKYLALRKIFESIGKENIKLKIGFTYKFNLIFIGRLYHDKWPHHAIDVLQELLKICDKSIALHFVGDGEMKQYLQDYALKNNLLNNIFFHGESYDENRTGELLFASDIMIMPGCVGLSANHAFCFDCPVITFETTNAVPAHGPEIEYIVNRKTGFVIKNNDIRQMANTIKDYLQDDVLKKEMLSNIRNLIETTCSIEKFSDGFLNAIKFVNQE